MSKRKSSSLWDQWERVHNEINLLKDRITEKIAQEEHLAERISNEINRRRGKVRLTPRQWQILKIMIDNVSWTNKEIASSLNVSERTIKFHVSALLLAYSAKNRRELIDRCLKS
jgi:DNA-binding NarL/FixJ family response regulator